MSQKVSTQTISQVEARRIFLQAQGFYHKPQRLGANRADLKKVMKDIHLLQLDAIPVVARTQYIPIFSRYGCYDVNLLDKIAYKEDQWFEAWAHEASLLSVEMEPLLRWLKKRSEQGMTWGHLHRFASSEKEFIRSVYRQVQERGPLKAKDLEDPRRRKGGSWGGRSHGTWALDWLFRIGKLGIRRRGNFVKEFDLIENIVPEKIRRTKTPSEKEALKELILLSAKALGVATEKSLLDYFRLPAKLTKSLIEELVEDKKLQKVHVEGWKKPAYFLPRLKVPKAVHTCALLSPFDPVVWHRERTEELFNFFYRIEIYTPEKKRQWGYYVLPFLLGDSLVGRVDVKMDREKKTLNIPAAFAEEGCNKKEVADSLAGELQKLGDWLGAESIVVGRKGNLARSLTKNLNTKL